MQGNLSGTGLARGLPLGLAAAFSSAFSGPSAREQDDPADRDGS